MRDHRFNILRGRSGFTAANQPHPYILLGAEQVWSGLVLGEQVSQHEEARQIGRRLRARNHPPQHWLAVTFSVAQLRGNESTSALSSAILAMTFSIARLISMINTHTSEDVVFTTESTRLSESDGGAVGIQLRESYWLANKQTPLVVVNGAECPVR